MEYLTEKIVKTTWTVYDSDLNIFHGFTNEEFSSLLDSTVVTLTGEYKQVHNKGKVWVDAEIKLPIPRDKNL